MHRRSLLSVSRRASNISALVPLAAGAMTIALSFQGGGYGTRATALATAEMAVLLALWLVLASEPFATVGASLAIAVTALVGLAGWMALSGTWSLSAERAAPEAARTALYAVTLALFGLAGVSRRRIRTLVLGLAAASVAVAVAALGSRTLPDLVSRSAGESLDQLAYPISYWNGLGLLAVIGGVLCFHLTCRAEEPMWIRMLAAAALPLLVATLYATLSRSAAAAALAGTVLYLLLARPPGLLGIALALAAPIAAAVAAVHVTTAARFAVIAPDPATISDARWIALALAVCAAGAGVLRHAATIAHRHHVHGDGQTPRVLPAAIRRDAAVVALLVAVVAVAMIEASRGDDGSNPVNRERAGPSRLLSTESSGRFEYWTVAVQAADEAPFLGEGAGTFELLWARERRNARLFVRDAHSLYLETFGELGLGGLALLLVPLAAIAAGLIRRVRRDPERALWAALLTATTVWTVHAAVDWDWELPAVSLWVFAVGGATLGERRGRTLEQPGALWRRDLLRWGLVAACVAVALLSARLAIGAARLDAAVDAAEHGDCNAAEAHARASLHWRDQSRPYVVLALCRRSSRPEAAKQAMFDAVERDPNDWRLHYDLALVLAAAGADARAEADAALELNPLDGRVRAATDALSGGTRSSRRDYAQNAPFLLPYSG